MPEIAFATRWICIQRLACRAISASPGLLVTGYKNAVRTWFSAADWVHVIFFRCASHYERTIKSITKYFQCPGFLSRSANLPTGLYILPSVIFLTWAKSWSFHQMKGICVNFLEPDLFFDSFTDVSMATDFGQNLRNDFYSTRWHFATDSNIAIPLSRW